MREHLMATVILCEECTRQGRTTAGTIADHIKPLAKAGTSDRSNYQLLCKPCDQQKQISDQGKNRRIRSTIGLDGWPI
jgi:5-methylcytosine-specific restriction protein A